MKDKKINSSKGIGKFRWLLSLSLALASFSQPARALVSDDFQLPGLDTTLWTFVDPVGDGSYELVGSGTADARLLLSVPSGTNHDVWSGGNRAVRVMQPVADEDFEVEAKFESEPTQRYQMQGLLVEQDAGNFLRYDLYSDGSNLRVFAARIVNGSPAAIVNQVIAKAPTVYLRLSRQGDQWTPRYSYDGVSWTAAGGFAHGLGVTAVGVFAANAGGNPAFTAAVDYVFDTAAPIAPEDGLLCAPGEVFGLTTLVSGAGTVVREPAQGSYGCGESVTLTAQPEAGWTFLGWGGAVVSPGNPVVLTIEGATTVTAEFAPSGDTTAPQIGGVTVQAGETTATLSWTTDEPSTGTVSYGESGAYGSQASSPVLQTAHGVTLSGLAPGTTYHYSVSATDASGNTASTGDATFTTAVGGASGPSIAVWYGNHQVFGGAGVPQFWANVLGNVSDPDGVASLTYSVNGGPESQLNLGPASQTNPRLTKAGDFNAEIDFASLSPGLNDVQLHAVDNLGNENTTQVTLEYIDDVAPPQDYSIDWASVSDVSSVAQIVDGKWELTSEGIHIVETGYDRLVAVGDLAWANYEALVEVVVNEPVTSYALLGLGIRWIGHSDCDAGSSVCSPDDQPRVQWWPLGAFAAFEWNPSIGNSVWLAGSDGGRRDRTVAVPTIQVGVNYLFKVRVETLASGHTEYGFKYWPTVDPEPEGWYVAWTADPGFDPAGGSLLLTAHFVDATFRNVSVQGIAP